MKAKRLDIFACTPVVRLLGWRKKRKLGLAFAAAILVLNISTAPAVTIDFEGPHGSVNNYYNGGTDSTGASGPNLGVSFLAFVVDGDDIFFVTQFPNNFATDTFLAFINVPAGFTSLSLGVHTERAVLINTWSDLSGGGSQIGSILLSATSTGFDTIDVPFTGIGKSVQFIAPDGHLDIDDVRFTTPTNAVPSPIVGTGLPGLIFASGLLAWWRRKRKVTAAAV